MPNLLVLLFLTTAIPLVSLTSASPSIDWTKGYTFGSSESHPHAGVQTADGGFFVVGDGMDYTNSTVKRHVYALRTDGDGNQLWQWTSNNEVPGSYNYGKFGLELGDGSLLIAGASSVQTIVGPVLTATIHRLSSSGSLLSTTRMPNQGWATHQRDGFMALAHGEDGSIIATGWRGGQNASMGYPDEAMFLMGGVNCHAHATKFSLPASDTDPLVVVGDVTLSGGSAFRVYQGMRLFHDPLRKAYIVSHTVSLNGGDTFQFGLSSLSYTGTVNWMKSYPASSDGLAGHASHPYTLAFSGSKADPYIVGGLAVIYDQNHIEQTEGRLVAVDPDTGALLWDRRYLSNLTDTNTECYGTQPLPGGSDGAGYITVCGTGVEPELHPHDPATAKTWRVLAFRTSGNGTTVWESVLTSDTELQNNTGEYVIVTARGDAAVVLMDSQTWGSSSTGGNFALMKLVKV